MSKKRLLPLTLARIGIQAVMFLAAPALFSEAFHGIKEIIREIGQGEPLVWTSFLVKLLFLCGMTVLSGRVFCGWACAFGAVGDWVYGAGKWTREKLGKKEVNIPGQWAVYLQKVKYAVLLCILTVVFFGKEDFISRYSPWDMFARMISGNVSVKDAGIAGMVLFFIFIGMFFYERFFCQFFCPLGAVFSLLPVNPMLRWRDNRERCITNCGLCKRNCPVHIKPGEDSYREAECIRCGRCMGI